MHERKLTVTRYVSWGKIIQPLSSENGGQKLKAKGVPKSEIITITGHRQEQSVEAYDSGNEDEQRQLSNIIDGKEIYFNQTTSRAPLQPLI